jgi:Rrf2 family protein
MFSLTRKTDYAIVALAGLARPDDLSAGRASSRDLAERYDLPLPLLRNILKRLTNRGLVISSRGPQGGYRLARDPDRITLAEVVEAIEGPVQLAVCCRPDEDAAGQATCELEGSCEVQQPIRRINRLMREVLRTITLAQVAADEVPMSLRELVDAKTQATTGTVAINEMVPCTCHERGIVCDHSSEHLTSNT